MLSYNISFYNIQLYDSQMLIGRVCEGLYFQLDRFRIRVYMIAGSGSRSSFSLGSYHFSLAFTLFLISMSIYILFSHHLFCFNCLLYFISFDIFPLNYNLLLSDTQRNTIVRKENDLLYRFEFNE